MSCACRVFGSVSWIENVYCCLPERVRGSLRPRTSRRIPRTLFLPCRNREFYRKLSPLFLSMETNDLSRRVSRELPENRIVMGSILGNASTLRSSRKRNSHAAQQDISGKELGQTLQPIFQLKSPRLHFRCINLYRLVPVV